MKPPFSRTAPLFACVVALSFWGCGGSSESPGGDAGATGGAVEATCEPGETRTCVGPGACDGGQRCASDGSEWLACDCGSEASTGGTGGSEAATGGSATAAGGSGEGGSTAGGAGGAETGTGASGSGATGSGATGGTVTLDDTLDIYDGRVAATSNTLGIQGAVSGVADETTAKTLTQDFAGDHACIAGDAGLVDAEWGAAIEMTLNQPIDANTGEDIDPLPYDGTELKGFSFTVSGREISTGLHFVIEDASPASFCNPWALPVEEGENTFLFEDLTNNCLDQPGTQHPDRSKLVRLEWWVVGYSPNGRPFDFCISNVRAITE